MLKTLEPIEEEKVTAADNSEALKVFYAFHKTFVYENIYFNFLLNKNGNFSSKLLPNLSLEFENVRIIKGQYTAKFFINDKRNYSKVYSESIRRIMAFDGHDWEKKEKFELTHLDNRLGFGAPTDNDDIYPQHEYLLMNFKKPYFSFDLSFQYREINDKRKIFFGYSGFDKTHWNKLNKTQKKKLLLKVVRCYKEMWGEPMRMKKNPYVNLNELLS